MAKRAIVVVGYPKSGNTWATRLVAQLLDCPVRGFLGEPENEEIAIEGSDRISEYEVFKAHHSWEMLSKSFTSIHKAIYIVRDPRDVVVSGANYFDIEKFKSFRDVKVDGELEAMVETVCYGSSYPWCNVSWSQHVSSYLSRSYGILVVRYEDLLNSGKEQLKRIASFLGVERSDQEIETCLEAQSFDAVRKNAVERGDLKNQEFLREGKARQYLDSLAAEQIREIELSCSREMSRLGYLSAAIVDPGPGKDSHHGRRPVPGAKFILVRPQGGLNDMLCQIEKCCRYAEQTGRYVIVDTNYENSHYFHDDFDKYFLSAQRKLLLSSRNVLEGLEKMNVFPGVLSGRVNSYTTDKKEPRKPFVDSLSKEEISFDFSKPYAEQLLVHHQLGGGDMSLSSLLRLRLKKDLKLELERRLAEIGGDYIAVHVRHTDYQTNYVDVLKALVELSPPRVFVASDNQFVVDAFRAALKNTKVFSFARGLSSNGEPIHIASGPRTEEVFVRNQDAILDLLMLAFAYDLRLCKVSEWKGFGDMPDTSYSGFSILAGNLRSSKIVLKYLLSPIGIRFGLD